MVRVQTLLLACLADPRALTDGASAQRRFDDEGSRQAAPLGGPRLIQLLRDPAHSLTEPPPRLCRILDQDVALRAPLMKIREPESMWLITLIDSESMAETAGRSADRSRRGAYAPLSAPRAIVDESGRWLAFAQPVSRTPGGQ
jgi:hypothetical protein